jgi:hypothetical protein
MTRPLASRVRLRFLRSLSTLALGAAWVLFAAGAFQAAAADPIARQDPQASGTSAYLPAEDDVEMRYALALSVARRGDLDAAIATLAELAARPPQGELGAHVASDLERTRLFQALRAKYLASLAESGGELRLEIKGREITFVVQTVEPERVVFRNTAFGIGSVPLAELDSIQIAKQISRDFDGESGRWVRLYPYVLAGDERGPQFLKRDCKDLPEGDKLLADAEQWYPAMVSLADAAALFAELAANPSAMTGERAKEVLASIKELVAKHGELEAVRGRIPQLRELATHCLEQTYDAKDLIEQLAGRVENLENGGLKLVYEFDQDKELKDFKTTPAYPAERIAVLPPLKAHATQGVFELKKSALVAAGTQSWRHIMPFKGPITVRCRMQVEPTTRGGAPTCFWMIGACDNGAESYVALQELGTAIAIDLPTSHSAYADVAAAKRLMTGTPYDLELVYDGQTVRTKVAKQVVKEVPAGARSYGDVFFLVHSDSPVRFDRIEIEVQPGGMGNRGPWLREKLREMGLGED